MVVRFLFIFGLGLLFPFSLWAQNPSVVSFNVSPTSINSGYPVDFYWTLQDAGGYSFYYLCSSGIKFKYTNGSSLDCGTRLSSTVKVNDYLAFPIYNITGGTKSVTVRLVPKDAGGQDYDAGARDTTITVATLTQPITSFYTTSTTTLLGGPVNIYWSSQIIDGVNLSIECKAEIHVSSPSYSGGFMPCGEPVFATDLPSSGSLVLNFANPLISSIPLRLTLLPAISPKSYDGTHAVYIDFNVVSDVLPDPQVISFTASSTLVNSGENTLFKWVTEKAVGANLQISCNVDLVATSSNDGIVILPCGSLAFGTPLASSSLIYLSFQNKSSGNQTVTISLLPSKKIGEYDSTRAKSITLTVKPPIQLPVASVAPIVVPAALTISTTAVVSPVLLNAPKFVFTQVLRKGSKGVQVIALQDFFKKDPAIYPEGIVSGYFGPATERAVQHFQKKYGLVTSGSPNTTGFGVVGPKTRSKLNEL